MNLTQGLHRALQQTPDLPATIFQGRVRSWAQCGDRVARLAGGLRSLGINQDDRVAILALNSDNFHEIMLAAFWADAVIVPVNTRWSAAEIAFSLDHSQTRVLIVDDSFSAMVDELKERSVCLSTVIHCGEEPAGDGMHAYEQLIAAHDPVEDAVRGGDSVAGIYYTGGTTGMPKGVMLSHTNLITSALGSCATGSFMPPNGRLLHTAPMFHIAAGSGWIARNLLGGTHVIVPGFSSTAVAEAISRHRVTEVVLVATMIQMLVDDPEVGDVDLSSLQRVIYGAAPISEALLERAAKRLPTTEFIQLYGMTELGPVATALTPADHQDHRLRRSAGRAAPHAQVRVVDEHDHDVPTGTVGEVICRGGHVMLGYLDNPEETARALRGGWMHTGDGGYLDERGYLYIVDRIKDMIISGGENVYSAEVENALAKHEAVAGCAVIGVPDDEWGERVHAVVVLVGDVEPTLDELRTHVKGHIAGYKAPRSVEYVDALPLSAAGKILKRELRERYWNSADRAVN